MVTGSIFYIYDGYNMDLTLSQTCQSGDNSHDGSS